MIWHQCLEHRIDPSEHRSRKAANNTEQQRQEKMKDQQRVQVRTKRKAPEIEDEVPETGGSMTRKARKERDYLHKQSRFGPSFSPPMAALHQRIRDKEAANKVECATDVA